MPKSDKCNMGFTDKSEDKYIAKATIFNGHNSKSRVVICGRNMGMKKMGGSEKSAEQVC